MTDIIQHVTVSKRQNFNKKFKEKLNTFSILGTLLEIWKFFIFEQFEILKLKLSREVEFLKSNLSTKF